MPSSSTLILLAAGLLLGPLALLWGCRRRSRAFVEVQQRYRAWLRRHGLTEARHFLDASAAVVSGHPGRSVARIALADGDETIHAFLKRESRVSWIVRLAGAAAGFGFVSRSLREARILEALAREGVGCPEWLAAGEDERGRAFLLVRETPGTTELRAWLGRENDPAARLRLARSLGAALARMHAAGFTHPDLYSKHVLVDADGETVQFLDWQRSRRRLALKPHGRARDLAALHATLADAVVSPRERLACLRSYAAGMQAGRPATAFPHGFVKLLVAYAQRLLRRRHIREKRQPPLPRGVQEWTTLHGGELCVTPALASAWPGRSPAWLALDQQPAAPEQALLRRWLADAAGSPALLVRRRRLLNLNDLMGWLRGRPPASPEQRQAELLLRLQRHAAPAPRVLAMGRRVARGRVESFLLTQPDAGIAPLASWLARQARRSDSAPRGHVLLDAGVLLRRLHDATCYLARDGPADVLAVRVGPAGRATVVLAGVDRVEALRRPRALRARRDLTVVQRALAAAGCGDADRRRFQAGYDRSALGDATDASPPRPGPSYRTAE